MSNEHSTYKGRAKCGFCEGGEAKRAKWRSATRFACDDHKDRIASDRPYYEDVGSLNEFRSCYETWFNV